MNKTAENEIRESMAVKDKIVREPAFYAFSPEIPAQLRVKAGETVCFETYDCFHNLLLPENSVYEDRKACPGNPVSGPLYIEGACPGDLLKVQIVKIKTGPLGVVMVGPKSGCMRKEFKERQICRIPVRDGRAWFHEKVSFPLRPMIGTIGTAPKGGAVSSMIPKNHGGNMDCTKIGVGACLYLPVAVEGALLSMGDVHGRMGDGEVEDCGLEIEAEITVTVDVVKNPGISWPVVETEDSWIAVASQETVEEAWQQAVRQMFEFLTAQAGIDKYEAGMLLTLAGDLAICQTVNPLKTVRMEFPKEIIVQYGFTEIREGLKGMEKKIAKADSEETSWN